MATYVVPPPFVLTGLPAAPANGTYRLLTNANGTFLQLWNPTTAAWHTVFISGAAGVTTLAIGPAEA